MKTYYLKKIKLLNIVNTLAFTNYYALLGLLALPLVFLIVKFFPPTPKKIFFSSFHLIDKIKKISVIKKKIPFWLLVYRLILIGFIILFFCEPYLKVSEKKNNAENVNNYIIVADIGWSISKEWDKFKKIVNAISIEAEKKNKKVTFYHSNTEENYKPKVFKSSKDINQYLKKVNPLPWQFEKSYLKEILNDSNNFKNNKVFFIFSKFDRKSYSEQIEYLNFIDIKVKNKILIDPVESIIFLKNINISKENIKFEVISHALSKTNTKFTIRITNINNQLVFKKDFMIEQDQTVFYFNEKFPLKILNQIHKIEIIEQNHAGAKYYFDDYSKKRKIGIFTENFSYKENPLLSPVYYLEKSLNKDNILKVGSLEYLIKLNCSVIIIPDKGNIPEKDQLNLNNWLNNGGTLIRFSNTKLAKSNSNFLSTSNQFMSVRNVGRTLSMSEMLTISPFKKTSIFHGLPIPKDIVFKKQLIIDNDDSNLQIVASLSDKTPLVSLGKRNLGKIFLFHITANNDWSNLPISSLFAGMLQRIILLSEKNITESITNLNLTKEINSFGDLKNTIRNYTVKDSTTLKKVTPSKEFPPGIYENNELTVALNLSNKISDKHFKNSFDKSYKILSNFTEQIIDLKPLLIKIILFMFITDMIISIMLQNYFKFISFFYKKKKFMSLFFFLIFLVNSDSVYSKNLLNETYLAYIKTNDEKLNAISYSGLNTIKNLLETRTSVSPKAVIEIDIIKDPIYSIPFLYWPLSENLFEIDMKTKAKIKSYLASGGMILFDVIGFSRENFSLENSKFKNIKNFLSSIEANNLTPITKDHTLTKSFYLLKKFPGRWDNKNLLIESNNLELNDGVSSVILGFNDWASAWALDSNNNPIFPVVPGGERQREISYRFGINITIYALTGNYKSDQIHFKSILNRLNNAK